MILNRLHLSVAVLGFSAMSVIGWNLGAGAPVPAGMSALDPPTRPARPGRSAKSVPGPTGEAARQLAAIRASRDPGERMRVTIELASMLPASEFATWMNGGWFTIRGGAELTLFTRIIQERWMTEDPEGLLLWSLKNEYKFTPEILTSWAASDPRKILDFFKRHPDARAELRALTFIATTDPALAFGRLQEMLAGGVSAKEAKYADEMLGQLARRSPAVLEAGIDSLPAGLKSEAEFLLLSMKMEGASAGEFQKLLEHPAGIKVLQSIVNAGGNDALKVKIFDHLADLPASWLKAIAAQPFNLFHGETVEKWFAADLEGAGFSKQQADSIRLSALSWMSYKQPEEALRWLGGMEVDAETRRTQLQKIFEVNRNNPGKVDAMLAQLDSEEERQSVRESLATTRSPVELKAETPADWLNQLAALDPKKGTPYSHLSQLQTWDSEKLGALAAQFRSMPDESKRNLAVAIAGKGYDKVSPIQAETIRYLVSNPELVPPENPNASNPNQGSIILASRYVHEVAVNDPGAASDWIRTLADGDAKLWAQKNLLTAWSQYDPQAADQWFNSLPADVRTQVNSLKKPRK